jgi:hypothetical protein
MKLKPGTELKYRPVPKSKRSTRNKGEYAWDLGFVFSSELPKGKRKDG